MNTQFIADGVVAGATIALGATGVTLTYSIMRFSNFAHGELISCGGYLTLLLAGGIGSIATASAVPIDPFSVGWGVLAAGLIAMIATGLLALLLDALLFRRLRGAGASISVVMASFGASMALRALLEVVFTSKPAYFSRELEIATPVAFGLRATPDQLLLVVVAAVLVAALYLLLGHTSLGRSMRAVSENPALARVGGIDVGRVERATWLIGGALACASGVMLGLVVQIRPFMGFDLLLPLFAAAILGGIGSVPGALIGGLVIGLSEAATVQWLGAEWRAGVAFAVLIAMLLVRPQGLFASRL
jgi:branched-chain amino acid transport system permease protein